jgi:hypothetical protein
MIANAALLAALTVFLIVGWLAGELIFLAPYKAGLFRLHGTLILEALLLVFLNLCAAYYRLARWVFLRDTGRKLRHLDHQLKTPDAVLDELRDDLAL